MYGAHPSVFFHARRVAFMAREIAARVCPDVRPAHVVTGAFLHDIGKITWPAELYEKVSLTAGDWEIKDG